MKRIDTPIKLNCSRSLCLDVQQSLLNTLICAMEYWAPIYTRLHIGIGPGERHLREELLFDLKRH